jgi:indolepyruvate ferredoxin oxidoreductase alpha subunit
VQAVEKSFELSEASNTPVMLELRIRACHVYGSFTARDNARPAFTLRDALDHPRRDANRIVLPPASYLHEREKVEKRWPAAVRFIEQHQLNEFFDGDAGDIGIVMQGGMYNTALRALEVLGLADVFGASRIPLYVLNVTYPLIDAEFARFCVGKKAILIIEEGQPEFIEQAVNTILRRADIQTRVEGKGMLPMAGEYTGGVMKAGLRKFVAAYRPDLLPDARAPAAAAPDDRLAKAQQAVAGKVHGRPPSFCTGCPERPIFAAMTLVERELGAHHVSCDRLSPVLDPAAVQSRQHHHGLWPRRRRRRGFQRRRSKRAIALVGDGGFWRNGLASSVSNAVFNKSDNVLIVVDNGYSAATGGQDVLSSAASNSMRSTRIRSRRRCAASASPGCARSRAPMTSARCATRCGRRSRQRSRGPRSSSRSPNACSTSSDGCGRCCASAWKAASAWCANASASIPTPAPAITPASGSRAAPRSRSRPIPIRCGGSR